MDMLNELVQKSPVALSLIQSTINKRGIPVDALYRKVNKAYSKMIGIEPEQLVGQSLYTFLFAEKEGTLDNQEKWKMLVDVAFKEYKIAEQDFFFKSVDRWRRVEILPLFKDYFICILKEMTPDELRVEEMNILLQVNLDMLCITDTNATFLKVNQAFEDVLGYSRLEVEGKNLFNFIHEDDIAATVEATEGLAKKEAVLGFINRYLCKDGSYKYLEWRSEPIGNFIYSSARDVTENILTKQKEALFRKEILEKTEQYELAIRGSNDGIWDWDLRTNNLYLSQQWKAQIGFIDDELPNEESSFFDRLHPADKDRLKAKVEKYLRGTILVYDDEFRLQHKDGSYRWIRARGEALRDQKGIPYRMAGSHSDITEKKRIDEELKKSEEKHRLVTENMSDVITIFNMTKKKYTFASHSMKYLMGYTAEEVLSMSPMDLVKPEYVEKVREAQEKAVRECTKSFDQMKRYLIETERIRKGGTVIWVETAFTCQVNAQNEVELLGVSRNIDERKRNEEKILELSYKDQLTGAYNRRYFDDRVYEEIQRSDRYQRNLSIIMMDLDHFKKVNDRWGHPVGDAVLKRVVNHIVPLMRASDVFARIGGEEFGILLPETNLKKAYDVAEKLRTVVKEIHHPLVGRCTASFGVAQRMEIESYMNWYKRSDDALYQAKEEGRNRVIASEGRGDMKPLLEKLEWKEEYSSGNEEMDVQHRAIMSQAKTIAKTCIDNVSTEKCLAAIEQLSADISGHIQFEEELLEKIAYPYAVEHAEEHKLILEKMQNLRSLYEERHIDIPSVTMGIIEDIVIAHVLLEDYHYYSYIEER